MNHGRRALVLASMAVVGMAAALTVNTVFHPGYSGVVPETPAQVGTPVPLEYHALATEPDAIDRALDLFPEDKQPHDITARLVSKLDAASWRLGATPEPGTYNPVRLAGPAWVVGIMGVGLTMCDFAPPDTGIGGLPHLCDSTNEIEGIYYVLNAPDAMVINIGKYTSSLARSLSQTQSDSLAIIFATPQPLIGVIVSTPLYSVPVIVTSTLAP